MQVSRNYLSGLRLRQYVTGGKLAATIWEVSHFGFSLWEE